MRCQPVGGHGRRAVSRADHDFGAVTSSGVLAQCTRTGKYKTMWNDCQMTRGDCTASTREAVFDFAGTLTSKYHTSRPITHISQISVAVRGAHQALRHSTVAIHVIQ